MEKNYNLLRYHMSCNPTYMFGHAIVAGLLASNSDRVDNYAKYLKECGKQGIQEYNEQCYSEFMENCGKKPTDLTKDEAIYLMKKGFKVTHRNYFADNEWVACESVYNDKMYVLEDGVTISADEFWKYRPTDNGFGTGWDIWHPQS